ncbi:MAG: hypothetical protein WC422_01665 [Candidatus Paceibacterota bacterium]
MLFSGFRAKNTAIDVIGNTLTAGNKKSTKVVNKDITIFIVPFLPDKSNTEVMIIVGKKVKTGAAGESHISIASLIMAKNSAI